jgi:hypothetical protein
VYTYDIATNARETLYKRCLVKFDEEENAGFSYFLLLKNLKKSEE